MNFCITAAAACWLDFLAKPKFKKPDFVKLGASQPGEAVLKKKNIAKPGGFAAASTNLTFI